MKKLFWSVLIFAIIMAFLFPNAGEEKKSNARALNEDYGFWREPYQKEFITIGKALSNNNIGGCGSYYIKEKNGNNTELMVACTSDGKNFRYYLVWPAIEDVIAIEDDGIDKPNIK